MTRPRFGFRSQKIVILALLLEVAGLAAADAPTIDPADDSNHFGSPEEILFWTPEQQVAGYRNAYLYPRRLFIGDSFKQFVDGKLADDELTKRLYQQADGFLEFIKQVKS